MMGKRVRDKVTGLEGVVTGKATYITGCDQVCVQPKVDKDGKYTEGRWIDITRVEVVDEQLAMANETPDSGPDIAPPVR